MKGDPGPGAGTAALIAVGTELVADGRPDTNGTHISRELISVGFETVLRMAVADDEALIAQALQDAAQRFSLVVVTGGLGPTVDDVTREAVSRAFGLPLERDERIVREIHEKLARFGRPPGAGPERQAMVPQGAEVMPNDNGTAPGLLISRPGGVRVALMPGVPQEMERMLETQLLPRLKIAVASEGALAPPWSRALKVSGLSESNVQDRVMDLFAPVDPAAPSLTLLTSPGEVTIIARGRDTALVERAIAQARLRLGEAVFAEDVVTSLESAVGSRLRLMSLTVSTAESCTGGLLGAMLTRIPGSSAWFRQGWITYADDAKTSMLGVDDALLERHGAVSEEVAAAMASGARERSGSDLAVSITGIAGPDGATPGKPVGLVYIAIAAQDDSRTTRHLFPGDRENVRLFAARTALNRLRLHIERRSDGATQRE